MRQSTFKLTKKNDEEKTEFSENIFFDAQGVKVSRG